MVMGNIIIVQLLLAIIITNFDESRKFTQKRNIIDEIELNIELGKTVGESIAIVLGEDFNLEQDEEKLKNVSVRLSKKKRKANQYHKIQIDSADPDDLPSLKSESMKRQYTGFSRAKSLNFSPLKREASQPMPKLEFKIDKGSDIADDMSIHINEELISDKLECGLGSTRAKSVFFPEYVVHDNLKPLNVQDIILEEDSSSEEEKNDRFVPDVDPQSSLPSEDKSKSRHERGNSNQPLVSKSNDPEENINENHGINDDNYNEMFDNSDHEPKSL